MNIDEKTYRFLLGWAKGKLCYKGSNTHLEPSDLINESIILCVDKKMPLNEENIKSISKLILSNEIGRTSRLISYDSITSENFNTLKNKETNQDLVCKKCKVPKPEGCFWKSTHKNGFIQTHSYCKDCEREISKICEQNKRERIALQSGTIFNKRIRGRSVFGLNNLGEMVLKFISLDEAQSNGFNKSNIVSCIKGRLKRYKGYVWNYG